MPRQMRETRRPVLPRFTYSMGRSCVGVRGDHCPDTLSRMSELISEAAEAYAAAHTKPFTSQLAEVAAWTRDNTDAPQMMAGLAEARLLQALIVAGGARRVLEIGTFTGLGALAMAEALP